MSEFLSDLLHFVFDYLITLVLDPKYKTKYFVDACWERPWIVVAESLARTEWRDNYRMTNPAGQCSTQCTPSEQSGSSTNSVSSSLYCFILVCLCFCHPKRLAATKKRFETLSIKSAPVDAMEDWLSTAVINTSSDVITYWSGMQAAGVRYSQWLPQKLCTRRASSNIGL